jgi:acetyltransferase-like isoleucine patch superfamily enzyme
MADSLSQKSPGFVGHGSTIASSTELHPNVIIGRNVTIEGQCIIGYPSTLAAGRPLVIGDKSLIRSHSIFYEGSTFGAGLVTGHRVTVRELFTAGKNLQIGTLADFPGHAEVGDYVRTHSSVHIGQKTKIGSFVWIFPYTVFTNDPHPPSEGFLTGPVVEDFAVIATHCTILPGVRIGARSLVGAQSLVNKDVAPDTVVGGVPARFLCATSKITLKDNSGPAYPWTRHFHRGYPADVVANWVAAAERV